MTTATIGSRARRTIDFTVYDQDPATLGRDAYLLTNAGNRVSRYQGSI